MAKVAAQRQALQQLLHHCTAQILASQTCPVLVICLSIYASTFCCSAACLVASGCMLRHLLGICTMLELQSMPGITYSLPVATYLNAYIGARAYCQYVPMYLLHAFYKACIILNSRGPTRCQSEGRKFVHLRHHNKSLSCCSFLCKEPSKYSRKLFAP